MNIQDFEILRSGRIASDPLGLVHQMGHLLNPASESTYSLQQAYMLAYFFRSVFSLGNYSESDKKLVKNLTTQFKNVDSKTQGSLMNFEMNEKAIKYMFDTKEPVLTDLSSNVLELVTMWIPEMESMSKSLKQSNENFDLFARVNSILNRLNAYNHIGDRVVFLNIVFKDILGLLPDWINTADIKLAEPSEKKNQVDVSITKILHGRASHNNKHFASIVTFLDESLPKTMYNILIRAQAFSKDMLIDDRPQYDLLYLDESTDSLLRRNQNFCSLIRAVLKGMTKNLSLLDLAQQQKTLDVVFRYFYAYHADNKVQAQSMLLESFQAVSNPVKYALSHQIRLFLTVLQKCGYHEFLKQIVTRFEWVKSICQKASPMANPKNSVDPLFGPSIEITVTRGTKVQRVIEIFREYSLIYFDVQCKSADINVRFVYTGAFNSRLEERRVIFEKERLKYKESFKGSIQVLLPGIYYFEFDNEYSWLTAKNISYRTVVFSSMEIDYGHQQQSQYLKVLNSQINFIPKKILAVSSHSKSKQLEVETNKQAKVSVLINETYHLSIEVPNDNYEYQLETQDKELVAERIITRIKKYFSTRNFDRTTFNIGQLEIISLKEFSDALRQSIRTGILPKKQVTSSIEKEKQPPVVLAEVKTEGQNKEPQEIHEIKPISSIQPREIQRLNEEISEPPKTQEQQCLKQLVSQPKLAQSEEVMEQSYEPLD